MKLRRFLGAFAAATVAVSAISVSSFAATFSGSHKIADSSWWTQDVIMGVEQGIPVSNLIGDLDPANVTSITFTGNTAFFVGYNTVDGTWFQTDPAVNEYTATNVLLESFTDAAGEKHDPYLHICLSKGDGVQYKIEWTVEAKDAAPVEDTKDDEKADETAPAEPTEETADVASEDTSDAASEDVSSEETADVSSEDVSSEDVSSEETAEDNSAWEEAVANASKDIADYLDVNASNKTLFLKYDDGKVGYADAAGIDIASITGVKFHVTFDELEVADESVWIGGGIGANSNSTSWLQNEWGRNEKPIIPDFENGTITWDNGAPIFSADDKYAQLWVCSWGGSFAVDSVELLFADNGDASADDTKTDDTKTDDTKGSPDTGVAGVAVAAGVVALAGAAVVVSRKRK